MDQDELQDNQERMVRRQQKTNDDMVRALAGIRAGIKASSKKQTPAVQKDDSEIIALLGGLEQLLEQQNQILGAERKVTLKAVRDAAGELIGMSGSVTPQVWA